MAGQYSGGSAGGGTEFYTNLPPKDQDALEKTITELTTTSYQTNYEFNAGEYDAAIGFFVNRGFGRTSAESTGQADSKVWSGERRRCIR